MCRPASQLWISLVLVLFSVLFSLIRCAPTADYRMDDFDWKPFTWKPIDWTWEPIDWKRFTSSPDEYNDYSTRSKDDVGLYLLIFLPGILIYVIIVICKEYCCPKSSPFGSSNTTLHAPPRNRTNATRNRAEPAGVHRPPPSNRREGTQLSFINQMVDFSSDSSRSNVGQNSNNVPRNNSTFPTSDRPPDYAHVVLSDLSEPDAKFPTVSSKPAESPPPNYTEENIPKWI